MHGLRLHQGGAAAGGWIWLFAGTAEGPSLAATLLERGWCVRVSVVGAAAARAYRPHPNLELQVGAIGSDAALEHQLQEMQPHWLVDATHPFALQITARLARVCRHLQQPWLQLDRREASPEDADPQVQLVQNLAELKVMALRDERLLLAIGARQLPQALAATPQCQHFARVLDQPGSLQAALACGLPDHHIACLRPTATGEGHLEEALCRRWRITRVLCRQGGGRSERLWRQVCQRLELPLLLLRRPQPATGLPLAALLEKLGHPCLDPPMAHHAILALTTEANQALAEQLATALLERQLAACVALKPVHSLYRWQGRIERSEEVQILIKSHPACAAALEEAVHSLHSYSTPQWLVWSAQAGEAYAAGLNECCAIS